MSELLLIEHCAPTLARIKTANLFSCSCKSVKALFCFLAYWNNELNPKGVYLRLMKLHEGRALIYVFRKEYLIKDLSCQQAKKHLEAFGYDSEKLDDVDEVINTLKKRICKGEEFPHEIGFFLGYPPKDVVGFIENNGKNFKISGCWKVYDDVGQAEKRFYMYKKCKSVYKRVYDSGNTVNRLTVPVKG